MINFENPSFEIRDFWRILFSDAETVATATEAILRDSTRVRTVGDLKAFAHQEQYFSVNPLHPDQNFKLENSKGVRLPSDKARRADVNVIDYRNFLFEMDGISLEDQQSILQQVSDLATTIVYSGGKSYHMIVSLSDYLAWEPHTQDSVAKYKLLWSAIADYIDDLAGKPVIDQSCKNPSRLSRVPGAVRGAKIQTLIHVGKLQSIDKLKALGIEPDDTVKPNCTFEGIDELLTSTEALRAAMSPAVQMSIDYLGLSAAPAGMYPELYRLAMWAIDDTGTPKATLLAMFHERCFPLLLMAGYPEYKLETAIHDAYREKRIKT